MRGWPLLFLLSILLEKEKGSYCQSDKAFQSLINKSENKGHKSRLPKHLCFPRKSKFIETKSSARSTLFFQTGILLRPKSGCFPSLSPDILSTQSFFFFHPFETLKLKEGKRHNSPPRCARPPGGDTGRRIRRRASVPGWSSASSCTHGPPTRLVHGPQLFILSLFHIVASVHNLSARL